MATSTLLPGSVSLRDLDQRSQAEWQNRRKRSWFQQGGSVPSGLCLAKAAVGAGVLTMVTQCAEVGLAITTLLLVVGVMLTVLSIRMIGEASIATRCGSFEDICDELLHPIVSFFTGLVNAINGLGAATTYLFLCGQAWTTILGCGTDSCASQAAQREVAIIVCGVVICIPMSICRKITVLRYFALVSLCGTLFLVVAMLTIRPKADTSTPFSDIWADHTETSAVKYMNIVNTIIFAYNCQSNVPQLTGELESEAWNSVNGMAWISTLLCFVIYFTASAVGVMTFGVAKAVQQDSLIELLQPYDVIGSGVLIRSFINISLVAIMISLMCCLEFHIFPVRQFWGWCFRKARGRSRGEEITDRVWCHVSCTRWVDIFGAFSTVALATFCATRLNDKPGSFSHLINFLGSVGATYTCYVIPPIWLIALRKRDDEWSSRSLDGVAAIGLLLVGISLFSLGTTAAIIGVTTAPNVTLNVTVPLL